MHNSMTWLTMHPHKQKALLCNPFIMIWRHGGKQANRSALGTSLSDCGFLSTYAVAPGTFLLYRGISKRSASTCRGSIFNDRIRVSGKLSESLRGNSQTVRATRAQKGPALSDSAGAKAK